MAAPISARNMVQEIRAKAEDRSTTNPRWTDTQILRLIDRTVQYLLNEQAKQRQDHDLDFVDLNVATELSPTLAATMANTGQMIREWRVPEYVNKIRLIENTTDGNHPMQIPKYPLNLKEQFRNDWLQQPTQFWTFTEGGDLRQKIGFVGQLTGVSTIRVWFVRRVAPLHYGITRVGLVGGNAAGSTGVRMWFADPALATTAGLILSRGVTYGTGASKVTVNNLYIGALVEFGKSGGGAGPFVEGSSDQIRKLTQGEYILVNDPTTRDWTWIFDEPLTFPVDGSFATCAQFAYSLVPQIGQEYHELVLLMAARRMANEAGSERIRAMIAAELAELHPDFLESTQDRQVQTPEFVEQYDDWYGGY